MILLIIRDVLIVLAFWLISPIVWVTLLVLGMIVKQPGELLLNQQRVAERIAEHLSHDWVFDVLYAPLGLVRKLIRGIKGKRK